MDKHERDAARLSDELATERARSTEAQASLSATRQHCSDQDRQLQALHADHARAELGMQSSLASVETHRSEVRCCASGRCFPLFLLWGLFCFVLFTLESASRVASPAKSYAAMHQGDAVLCLCSACIVVSAPRCIPVWKRSPAAVLV